MVAPPLIEPSQAKEVESEKKEDNTKTVYEYKVIRLLDSPGHTSEAGKERKVLATFDDLEKSQVGAHRNIINSSLYSPNPPHPRFFHAVGWDNSCLDQHRPGKEINVRIEIHEEACEPQKDEQKPRAPREVFVVMVE